MVFKNTNIDIEKYFKLILGGDYVHRGFNGMFANVYFRVGKGAYISGKEQLSDVITKDSNKPFDGVSTLKPVDAVKTVVT